MFFFFQAEDGIRDLVRSRGLGDVYKRQVVERAARIANVQVIIEGYAPSRHNGIESLSVTPDPGVIEVNVHPASSFAEIASINRSVYAEANACGLVAEKFQIDGRHIGTGGGSHVTVGGPTPSESVFLQNPKLLASLIRFWQNHPSLSYAFSGLFVGPCLLYTSDAADE